MNMNLNRRNAKGRSARKPRPITSSKAKAARPSAQAAGSKPGRGTRVVKGRPARTPVPANDTVVVAPVKDASELPVEEIEADVTEVAGIAPEVPDIIETDEVTLEAANEIADTDAAFFSRKAHQIAQGGVDDAADCASRGGTQDLKELVGAGANRAVQPGGVRAAADGVARVVGARVAVVAVEGGAARAHAGLALAVGAIVGTGLAAVRAIVTSTKPRRRKVREERVACGRVVMLLEP